MLTYATIFIASVIVASIAIFLYKVISNSSRSVYSSRERPIIYDVNPNYQKDKVTAGGIPDYPYGENHATPRHMAKTHPALPTETMDWAWKGNGKQSHQQPGHAKSSTNSSHCSLYELKPENPGIERKQRTGWPYREEKSLGAGKVYKVTRRAARQDSKQPDDLQKPWGW
jgi:hypothetical protein